MPSSLVTLPPNPSVLHQPSGGDGGSASDIEIEAREILQMLERIEEDTHRNFRLGAEAAVRY